MPRPFPHLRRRGRSYVGLLIHLASFTLLLLIVQHYYLLPALAKLHHASDAGRRRVQEISYLLLFILLLYLFAGLAITLRRRRFLSPPNESRSRTPHIDAWAEAGRRMEPNPPEDPPDDSTPQ